MKVGDWFDLKEGATALVVSTDGDRALVIDPYDAGAEPVWMKLNERPAMEPDEVLRRIKAFEVNIENLGIDRRNLISKLTRVVEQQAREASTLRIVKTVLRRP